MSMKSWKARVWVYGKDGSRRTIGVGVMAENFQDAKQLLESQHGEGNVAHPPRQA